jgi:phosphoribosylformylglycinamidine (FGAM) synthase-like enzyme
VPCEAALHENDGFDVSALFSESASRFVVEVPAIRAAALESMLRAADVRWGRLGEVTASDRLQVRGDQQGPRAAAFLIDLPLAELKEAWQKPLRW